MSSNWFDKSDYLNKDSHIEHAEHPVWIKAGFVFDANAAASHVASIKAALDKANIPYRIAQHAYDLNGQRNSLRGIFLKKSDRKRARQIMHDLYAKERHAAQ